MPSIFDKKFFKRMTQTERTRLANSPLYHRRNSVSADEKRIFIDALSTALNKDVQANSASERKKTALAHINAAKADGYGGQNAINLLNGTLRRGGLPEVEELVNKSPDEIMKLFKEFIYVADRPDFLQIHAKQTEDYSVRHNPPL